jgi:MYXO-CTERM domain-containing protein
MSSRLPALLAASLLLTAATTASAHSLLLNPQPLTSDDNAKSGPCGCYFGAGPEDPNEDATPSPCPAQFPITTVKAGSQLTVTWKETVNHTGKFRLAVSTKPITDVTHADMAAAVLYEADDTNSVSGGMITATITLPDAPCDTCALQLRQYMAGATRPYYYSCAALHIEAAGSSSSSGSTTSSSASSGGGGAGGAGGASGEGGSVGPGPAPLPPSTESGSCACSTLSPTTTASTGLVLFGLALLGLARRRSSCPRGGRLASPSRARQSPARFTP